MIRLTLNKVESPKVPEAVQKALQATLNDIANTMNEYCKQDTGALMGSLDSDMISANVGQVSWDREYAVYAYYKGTPSHDKNPKARLRWAHYAAQTHGKQWAEDIMKRAQNLWKR